MLQRFCAIVLVALFASSALAQEEQPAGAGAEPSPGTKGQVYRSVDAQGHVIFTDAPPAGRAAEEVKIAPVNTVPAASPAAGQPKPEKLKAAYEQFVLTSPQNDAMFGQEVESVTAVVEVSPALQDTDTVQFYLDGQPVGPRGKGLAITLTGLERGTHTVEARLLHADGRVLMSTGSVQFHIRRISAINKVSDNEPEKPQGWLQRWWGRDANAVADAEPLGGYGSARGVGGTSGARGAAGAGSAGGMPGMGTPADNSHK